MASLFKNNAIRNVLADYVIPDFAEKIAIAKRWHQDYHEGSLKTDKETSREQAFNQDFFIKILGYGEKPVSPASLIPKDTSDMGQLPDLILGYFDGGEKRVMAVVELKGASTPLDRPQKREGNMSPIQQAFKYKSQYTQCPFVIASNFYEWRLFQDTQLDYEEWTLDSLVDETDNYFNFRKFHYLLNRMNFTSHEGLSRTQELLNDIRIEEEVIGKKFYKEYKEIRLTLLRSLWRENESVKSNIDFGIEKAQKIIDRVVFICFCEDRGLLPDNTLARVLKYSENSVNSLWSDLKAFFEAVDSGSEKLEIPDGYNGGLFAPDAQLNALKIDDVVLKELATLGNYNFTEELSVNILGHIFEQSISDLEEIKEKTEESLGTIAEEKQKVSKRKKDGIFYTPDYIVDYIVEHSLGALLREKEEELKIKYKLSPDLLDSEYAKRERDTYLEYQTFLQNITVLDPACGSGAFLVKVFDYLLAENQRVGQILNDIFSTDAYYRSILKNNIYGVDINRESVEITKLSLWLKTAQKGSKLTTLDGNIKCGNSLIDDPLIAGDKAFDWNNEFSHIMQKGGFDVIVGNPPYVNIANIKSHEERNFYQANYNTVKNKSDLYSIFTELGYGIMKEKGILSFIFSNSWLGNDSFSKFRQFLVNKTQVLELIKLPKGVFKDATVTTVIISFIKKQVKENRVILKEYISDHFKQYNFTLDYNRIRSSEKYAFSFESEIKFSIGTIKLKDIANFSLGIKTSDDKRFIFDKKLDGDYYPMLRGRDITRYYYKLPEKWIWYKPELMLEKIGAGPRSLSLFLEEKIFLQDISQSIVAIYCNDVILSNDTLSFIYKLDKNYDFKFILSLLNSKLINNWFKNNFQAGLHIKVNQLQQIPIPVISLPEQKPFIEKADTMLQLNKDFYSTLEKTHEIFKHELGLEKLPTKLEKFYELSFDEFLQASKAKISIEKKSELLDFFSKKKDELTKMKQEIDVTDREIDQMVYRLYGLSEEEVTIIEKS